jgi:hypothetical protein
VVQQREVVTSFDMRFIGGEHSRVLCARPFEVANVLVAERESEVIDAGGWTRDPGSGIRDPGPGTRGSGRRTRSSSDIRGRRGGRWRFIYPRNDDRRLDGLSRS